MTTAEKALQFNLDPLHYGAIAEIGAGQEVARNFFQAGGASGTIAKTTSAYDMSFSDAIYGPDDTGRYVTKERLLRMLDREFRLVVQRLTGVRDPESTFFAFADTVSAKRYGVDSEDHGWMGIRFQHAPRSEPSQIVLHARLLDSSNTGQQNALGILGVNLIHSCYRYLEDVDELIDSLTENLVWGRVEIDYVDLDGPCFEGADVQALNLRLVRSSLGPVVLYDTKGESALPEDMLYRRTPLILRGTFRPFTHVHADMIECGLDALQAELGTSRESIVPICEMNIARYLYEDQDDVSDLQARVQIIASLGYNVMVSSHLRFFRIGEYFRRLREPRVGFVISTQDLYTIFDDKYYEGLDGGLLQASAQLFASDSKLLVYPNLMPDGELLTLEKAEVPDEHHYLFKHLQHNRRIVPLRPERKKMVTFRPDALADQIASGDEAWKDAVPELVRERIGELVL
jgi:hypothetical protein